MPLDQNTVLHLRWLNNQHGMPRFGGHIERGEPLTDPNLLAWLRDGLIELDPTKRGYVITDKGRDAIDKV